MKNSVRLAALCAILLLLTITLPGALFATSPAMVVGAASPQSNQGAFAAASVEGDDGELPADTADAVDTPAQVTNLPGHLTREQTRRVPGRHLLSALEADPQVAAIAAEGDQLVPTLIDLQMPPLATVAHSLTEQERVAYAAQVAALQVQVIAEINGAGGTVLYRLSTLSSGIVADIPGVSALRLARLPQVARISRVQDYQLNLSETVPAIGATLVHSLGVSGTGVIVGVIDSGIDFTHKAFGGPGTEQAFEDAYFGPNSACTDGTQTQCTNAKPPSATYVGPTKKVIGGYDFIGEEWSSSGSPIHTDSNPIDFNGHGTHVADIIAGYGYTAGVNSDGPYPAKGEGVAPGAQLFVLRACAAQTSLCSGGALLAAVDNAANMDRNPATIDPVDVVNLSVGSAYGQPEDDLVNLVDAIVDYGVVAVVSAGNTKDAPYIVSQPSIAGSAISVGQSTTPAQRRYLLQVLSPEITSTLTSAVWQTWSVDPQISGTISSTLIFGNGDGTNEEGCSAFNPIVSGKIVLVDRGNCSFTLKVARASNAGAKMVLIGMLDDFLPFESSDSGDRPLSIPAFIISFDEAKALRSRLQDDPNDVTVKLDQNLFVPVYKSMVDTSGRGPRINDGRIKPELVAPGASISADAKSGAQSSAFSGTSGAAPMVAGAAALLAAQHASSPLAPYKYKALLMNNADTDIYLVDPQSAQKEELAPITRMGSGQVNAASAYSATILAWDSTSANSHDWTGALSFGYLPAAANTTVTRTITITNLQNTAVNVALGAAFRYANDQNSGVQITFSQNPVPLPANGSKTVNVLLTVTPNALKPWLIDRGEHGGDGELFTYQEYDGLILLTPTLGSPIHLPWQVLPKAAAGMKVTTPPSGIFTGIGALTNQSTLVTARTESFDLVDQSPNIYNYTVGDCTSAGADPGCDTTMIDLKDVGVRTKMEGSELFLQFALTLWDKPYRAAEFPVEFDVFVDSDLDGEDDYNIYTDDQSNSSEFNGRNIVKVFDYSNSSTSSYSYTLAGFNTQNFILSVPAAAVGVSAGQKFGFAAAVYDVYFTNNELDCSPVLEGGSCDEGFHIYTAGKPAYSIPANRRSFTTAPNATTNISYQWSVAGGNASPSQIGLLFLYDKALVGRESDSVLLTPPTAQLDISKLPNAPAVDVGETIIYQYLITNTGTLTVTTLTVNDSRLGAITPSATTIGPGAHVTATKSYATTIADYPGPLEDFVTATAQSLSGDVISATASAGVQLTIPQAHLTVSKGANVTAAVVGQQLIYSYTILNNGESPLSGIYAIDDKAGTLSGLKTTLAPGESTQVTKKYTPKLRDMPSPLANTVTVFATPLIGSQIQATAKLSLPLTKPLVGLSVEKTPSVAAAAVGDSILYHYIITNIGETPVNSITASDDKLGSLTLSTNSLTPEAELSVDKSYTVLDSDRPGPIVNIVTVNGVPSIGGSVLVTASASVSVTAAEVQTGTLVLSKTIGIAGITPLCSGLSERTVPISTTVIYCYTVHNPGEQNYSNHSLVDSDLGQILSNDTQIVPPGGFYSVTMTKTLTISVTNVATWTATIDLKAQGLAANAVVVDQQVAATARISGPDEDQDTDTIPDNVEGAADVDGDNLPNFLDGDSDGDGLSDAEEVGPDPTHPQDSDGDGVPDFLAPVVRMYFPNLGRN